jgi:hypothetical protein
MRGEPGHVAYRHPTDNPRADYDETAGPCVASPRPAKYRIQISEHAGFYRNPFKRGGRAARWGKWCTVGKTDTMPAAVARAEMEQGRGLRRVRIMLGADVMWRSEMWQ